MDPIYRELDSIPAYEEKESPVYRELENEIIYETANGNVDFTEHASTRGSPAAGSPEYFVLEKDLINKTEYQSLKRRTNQTKRISDENNAYQALTAELIEKAEPIQSLKMVTDQAKRIADENNVYQALTAEKAEPVSRSDGDYASLTQCAPFDNESAPEVGKQTFEFDGSCAAIGGRKFNSEDYVYM